MIPVAWQLDLVALVPGRDDEQVLRGLLSDRHDSLGVPAIEYEVLIHPRRDAGCYHEAEAVLRSYLRTAHFALVLFDHEGCGQEARAPAEVARSVEERLAANGWLGRAAVVVVAPELEVWAWNDSPSMGQVLGWRGGTPGVRRDLAERGVWPRERAKPREPKEALETMLRERQIRRSPAIYRRLAAGAEFAPCTDPAFLRFREVVHRWFGPPAR
jgi:hypothetical protein